MGMATSGIEEVEKENIEALQIRVRRLEEQIDKDDARHIATLNLIKAKVEYEHEVIGKFKREYNSGWQDALEMVADYAHEIICDIND